MLGTTLADRYKITKALGSGGFSKTYLATDTQQPRKTPLYRTKNYSLSPMTYSR